MLPSTGARLARSLTTPQARVTLQNAFAVNHSTNERIDLPWGRLVIRRPYVPRSRIVIRRIAI